MLTGARLQVTSFKASKEFFDKVQAEDKEFMPFEVGSRVLLGASGAELTDVCASFAGCLPRAGARAGGGEGAVRGGVRGVGARAGGRGGCEWDEWDGGGAEAVMIGTWIMYSRV